MRTDSRDRFGTPLEQRFSRQEIQVMMEAAGLGEVRFSERAPYWCAVGIKIMCVCLVVGGSKILSSMDITCMSNVLWSIFL